VTETDDRRAFPWAARWAQLARAAGLRPTEPVLVALSGGADSVFLLQLVARAEPRPKVLAVHVDHGLRGGESDDDAAFCARLCARLSVPFARKRVELEDGPDLEARAREARYRALGDEARAAQITSILTGHHEDDALETLLMRWLRGSALPGLPGLKLRNVLGGSSASGPLNVVRPLVSMRREEVRRVLRDAGLEWREDSSNASERFTRNRVRHGLLPQVEEACGPEGIRGLEAFAAAVESFEDELACRTAHLAWDAPAHAAALRSAGERYVGGSLPRAALIGLATPLQRRALWRLIREGTGHAPSRSLLALLEADLSQGRRVRRALPGGWILQLRSATLHLLPPGTSSLREDGAGPRDRLSVPVPLPFADRAGHPPGSPLPVPGVVPLADGRAVRAALVEVSANAGAPRSEVEVELSAEGLPDALTVRTPRPGDRFHGLGAPGSRRLSRFLADAGIPREERARVPLVFAGDELIWVAGIRPCEARRVRPGMSLRLRLSLEGAAVAEQPSTTGKGLFQSE
jgi:tRNA(Ile)-lysidine synthase